MSCMRVLSAASLPPLRQGTPCFGGHASVSSNTAIGRGKRLCSLIFTIWQVCTQMSRTLPDTDGVNPSLGGSASKARMDTDHVPTKEAQQLQSVVHSFIESIVAGC